MLNPLKMVNFPKMLNPLKMVNFPKMLNPLKMVFVFINVHKLSYPIFRNTNLSVPPLSAVDQANPTQKGRTGCR